MKPTLISLLDQTRRVDEICINLPRKTLKGKKYKIPEWLTRLDNIRIYRTDQDWGPSTKLIPTLKRENYDTIIIVVDDDVIYGSKTVQYYIDTFYKRKCRDALTTFGSRINERLRLEEGFVQEAPPYYRFRGPRYVDIVSGHDYFVVTPMMFGKCKNGTFKSDRLFDYSKAPEECRWVDDIWFSGWLLYNGNRIWATGFVNGTVPMTNVTTIDTTSLCHSENKYNHNNNICIKWFRQRKGVDYTPFK
jgi:hypothetical protein